MMSEIPTVTFQILGPNEGVAEGSPDLRIGSPKIYLWEENPPS